MEVNTTVSAVSALYTGVDALAPISLLILYNK
jgi:hypothetical protein